MASFLNLERWRCLPIARWITDQSSAVCRWQDRTGYPRRREEARKERPSCQESGAPTRPSCLGEQRFWGCQPEWALARLAVYVRQVLGDGAARVEFSLAGIQAQSNAVLVF